MRIESDLLQRLCRLHQLLISKEKINLLDAYSVSLDTNPYEVKKLLSLLERLGVIGNLNFAGKAFAFELKKHTPISADLLMSDFGFVLISQEIGVEKKDPKDEEIGKLRRDNDSLRNKIEELNRDIECISKIGKSHNEVLDRARIDYGD